MASHRVALPSVAKICAHVKHLGNAAARRIRLYGKDSKSFPTPCLQSNRVVPVTTKKDPRIRLPSIPAGVFQCEKRTVVSTSQPSVSRKSHLSKERKHSWINRGI